VFFPKQNFLTFGHNHLSAFPNSPFLFSWCSSSWQQVLCWQAVIHEILWSPAMRSCVVGQEVTDVSNDDIAFMFRMTYSFKKSSYIPLPWRLRHCNHSKRQACRTTSILSSTAVRTWNLTLLNQLYVCLYSLEFQNLFLHYFHADIKVREILLSFFLWVCTFRFLKRGYFILWKCIAGNGKKNYNKCEQG
jgi:hypothetical protein